MSVTEVSLGVPDPEFDQPESDILFGGPVPEVQGWLPGQTEAIRLMALTKENGTPGIWVVNGALSYFHDDGLPLTLEMAAVPRGPVELANGVTCVPLAEDEDSTEVGLLVTGAEEQPSTDSVHHTSHEDSLPTVKATTAQALLDLTLLGYFPHLAKNIEQNKV